MGKALLPQRCARVAATQAQGKVPARAALQVTTAPKALSRRPNALVGSTVQALHRDAVPVLKVPTVRLGFLHLLYALLAFGHSLLGPQNVWSVLKATIASRVQ